MDENTPVVEEENNEELNQWLEVIKKIIRAILPLIGLDMLIKYIK